MAYISSPRASGLTARLHLHVPILDCTTWGPSDWQMSLTRRIGGSHSEYPPDACLFSQPESRDGTVQRCPRSLTNPGYLLYLPEFDVQKVAT